PTPSGSPAAAGAGRQGSPAARRSGGHRHRALRASRARGRRHGTGNRRVGAWAASSEWDRGKDIIAVAGPVLHRRAQISDNVAFPVQRIFAMPGSRAQAFVRFALEQGVLNFGDFTMKSGRRSPYFFNAGLFNDGASVGRLGQFYAQALADSGLDFDMLFGPAYKGIPLATTAAIALSNHPSRGSRSVPFAFNRKEAKDHGEGGMLVGAPLQGRVVIIDDVITAGTSVRESVAMIRAAGAQPAAVLIALDRMARAGADD